jgi:hypothetical protein
MSAPAPKRKRTKVLALGAAGALFCFWGACLPAWHNFVVFGSRAKAAEARTMVKALCIAQLARLKEGKAPGRELSELRTEIGPHNRFAYFIVAGEMAVQVNERFGTNAKVELSQLPARYTGELQVGVNGMCPSCEVLSVAAGNIDTDDDLDVWSASTSERTVGNRRYAPCDQVHEQNDTRCKDCWYPSIGD